MADKPVAKRADRVTIKHTWTQYEPDDPKRNGRLGTHRWEFGGAVLPLEFDVPDVIIDNPFLETTTAAMVMGFKQKIANGWALSVDTDNGKSATVAEKRAAGAEIIERLNEGKWNGRIGGVAKLIDVDALVAAMAATLKKNVVSVRAFVESKDEAGRKAFASSEQFAVAYAMAVANARPKSTIDTSELDAIPD